MIVWACRYTADKGVSESAVVGEIGLGYLTWLDKNLIFFKRVGPCFKRTSIVFIRKKLGAQIFWQNNHNHTACLKHLW